MRGHSCSARRVCRATNAKTVVLLRILLRRRLIVLLLLHLLLHLLLLQELALLHLLHHLLRSAHRAVGAESGTNFGTRRGLLHLRLRFLFRLLRLVGDFIVGILLRAIYGILLIRCASATRREDYLTWRTMAKISGEQNVIARSEEQLRKNVACVSGSIRAEDALIRDCSNHLGTCLGGDLVQNLLEARI